MSKVSSVDVVVPPESTNKHVDRRKFASRIAIGGLGAAAMSVLGGSLNRLDAATITDEDIVNFALNLEYLEAEFYSVASFGATLQQRGLLHSADVSAPTTGGHMVPNFGSSKVAFLAAQLRDDEAEHVAYLRKALGAKAAKKPAINLDALGFGFDNTNDFLKLARIFEDVGVSAYLGAAPLITNKTYLDVAARILATEAQHAGAIRVENVIWGVTSPAVDSKDIPATSHQTFDTDGAGLSIPRSTSQVLSIVYAGGSHSGGFYPAGLNGVIK
jgi:hypothetical protein